MSTTNRYLEFNSSYRNRNLWPQASEFEIPISQTGRKSQQDALDPVCKSSPIFSWSCNNFDNKGNPTVQVTIIANPVIPPPPLVNVSDINIFIIKSNNAKELQQFRDYYLGSIISDSKGNNRRIVEYIYLYQDSGGIDYAQITVATPFSPAVVPIICTINDPSTIDTTTFENPIFFIPKGPIQRNAYINYFIYNETRRESRRILQYEPLTKLLIVDTRPSLGGKVVNWKLKDNYSIREVEPDIPLHPGGSYPNLVNIAQGTFIKIDPNTGLPTSTTISFNSSNSTIILQSANLSLQPDDFYKNCGLRIIPNPVGAVPVRLYNYIRFPEYTELIAPLNEQRIISKSISFKDNLTGGTPTLVLEVNPPFSMDPYNGGTVNYVVELLGFSYDNFNPFSYTGSLVSQQEMVCYEVELVNLILPNNILSIGLGGLAAFYPYFYVELSNVSSPNGHLRNLIYSNVPSSSKATFRVPIDDTISPLISTFLKIDGDGMVQIIKFKPNDNLYFRVYLYDGQNFQTIVKERYSPSPPEPSGQISCLFSIRRV